MNNGTEPNLFEFMFSMIVRIAAFAMCAAHFIRPELVITLGMVVLALCNLWFVYIFCVEKRNNKEQK